MESFKDLRAFPRVDSQQSERQFTDLLKHIYSRHRNVVPVMAMGVAELKKELSDEVRAAADAALDFRTALPTLCHTYPHPVPYIPCCCSLSNDCLPDWAYHLTSLLQTPSPVAFEGSRITLARQ